MAKITARDATRGFAALLARVERGEEVIVTKRGVPVAIVSPYRPAMSANRQATIDRAVTLMRKGLPWGETPPPFTREEMHER
jgi:prevent-host-death family protein